jgi:CDP-diacylglycerol--glycerol-3-phosphate 3-phosphatidyltransferase
MGEPGRDDAGLSAEWSRLHHGLRPSRLVLGWLRPLWTVARPLAAARVPPAAITAVGLVLAVTAPVLTGRWPLGAMVLVLAAAAADGLDGAVAVVGGRASRVGAMLDQVADRVADTAFALVMWRCGAPLWLALVAGTLSLGQELARVAGPRLRLRLRLRTTITVAERPTRVICAVLACVCAAVSDASWPATVCAVVWVAATVGALAQLVRRARGVGPALP